MNVNCGCRERLYSAVTLVVFLGILLLMLEAYTVPVSFPGILFVVLGRAIGCDMGAGPLKLFFHFEGEWGAAFAVADAESAWPVLVMAVCHCGTGVFWSRWFSHSTVKEEAQGLFRWIVDDCIEVLLKMDVKKVLQCRG